jgi:hypothetical protein
LVIILDGGRVKVSDQMAKSFRNMNSILAKNVIFVRKFDFCQIGFLATNSIFLQKFDFWSKFSFSLKIGFFPQKFVLFLEKNRILTKNLNFFRNVQKIFPFSSEICPKVSNQVPKELETWSTYFSSTSYFLILEMRNTSTIFLKFLAKNSETFGHLVLKLWTSALKLLPSPQLMA